MKIFKYPLEVTDTQLINLPVGAKCISVQVQNSQICLWCHVDTSQNIREAEINFYGTGHNTPDWLKMGKHLGTVQLNGYVWHIFSKDIR